MNEFFSPQEIGELEGMKKKRKELSGNSTGILTELLSRLAEEAEKEKMKNQPLSADWLAKLKAEKQRKDQ